ncbi:MAG: hypothetical protein K2P62_06105 [Phocaeicola sp.]|nr:hypothetical protein [Phocaeicola sp.]
MIAASKLLPCLSGIVYSQYLGQIAGIHIAGNKADKHYYLPANDVNAELGTKVKYK